MKKIFTLALLTVLILACGAPTVTQDVIQTAIAQTQAASHPIPTFSWQPTATPQAVVPPNIVSPPTEMPLPIESPTSPTAPLLPTVNADLIHPGTYIVGKDIKPGLYTGHTDHACYWARLKDLGGTLDSILANDNSVGRYYIRVKNTDHALETACVLLLLEGVPQSSGELPTSMGPGTYLVGPDIRAGTYQGQAGSDMCYWARLSDVDGELESIIANDNAKGQFYIQILPTDFALMVACDVQFTGQ